MRRPLKLLIALVRLARDRLPASIHAAIHRMAPASRLTPRVSFKFYTKRSGGETKVLPAATSVQRKPPINAHELTDNKTQIIHPSFDVILEKRDQIVSFHTINNITIIPYRDKYQNEFYGFVGACGEFLPSHFLPEHRLIIQRKEVPDEVAEAGWYLGVWYPNYFHWLIQCLPRLILLRQHGWTSPIIGPSSDQLARTPFLASGLEMIGVAPSSLTPAPSRPLRVNRFGILEAGSVDRVLLQSLRKALPCKTLQRLDRKIYLRRGNVWKRRVLNEDQLSSELAGSGFDIVDCAKISVEAQITLFAEAQLIVSVHGAALANIVACPRDATIVEIADPQGHPKPLFYELASELSLRYACVQVTRVDNGLRANDWDYHVDPMRLLSWLSRMQLLN